MLYRAHLDVAGDVDLGVVWELEGVDHVVEEEVLATSTVTRPSLPPVPYQLLLSETSFLCD